MEHDVRVPQYLLREDKYFPKKPKAGEAPKLKVRPGMRTNLAAMDATHANLPCRIYFTLAPLIFACEAEAAGHGNNGGRCPSGTLYDLKSLMVGGIGVGG